MPDNIRYPKQSGSNLNNVMLSGAGFNFNVKSNPESADRIRTSTENQKLLHRLSVQLQTAVRPGKTGVAMKSGWLRSSGGLPRAHEICR